MTSGVAFGNAGSDCGPYRQWFVGPFVSAQSGPRQTSDVEIKWGCHQKGDIRENWSCGGGRTTITILIRGRFRLSIRHPKPGAALVDYLLEKEGDYLMWSSDHDHTWQAEEETVAITVRWKEDTTPLAQLHHNSETGSAASPMGI